MPISRNLARYLLQAAVVGAAAGVGIRLLWPRPQRPLAPPVTAPPITASVQAPPVNSFAPAVERAAPAVVNIYSSKVITRAYNPLLDDPLFQRFFGRAPVPRRRLESSLG